MSVHAQTEALVKHKAGRNNYHINQTLVGLFAERGKLASP